MPKSPNWNHWRGARRRSTARSTHVRARAQLLDRLRNQTRGDLDALNELTRLVEPPAWTNSINLARDSVRITGEAPQAALLLKILDSSPLFENSALDMVNRGARRRAVPDPHRPEEQPMTVGTLDRRTLFVLLGGLLLIAVLRFGVYGDRPTQVVAPSESVPAAEKRLERLRQIAATVPGKEAVLKQAAGRTGNARKGHAQGRHGRASASPASRTDSHRRRRQRNRCARRRRISGSQAAGHAITARFP